MQFETLGDAKNPAVLFFHAMGVIGASSERVAKGLQARCFFEFGSAEDHFKYRGAVMQAYPHGNFPVFEGMNHMQFQIRDPQGFAGMLESVMEKGSLPELPFARKA